MTLILDRDALVALERGERAMWVRLKGALGDGAAPVTHAGVLGQVWRGGARQARLAQALPGVDIRPLDEALGRSAGVLLAVAGHVDVIDSALVLLAVDGDEIVTGDPQDIERLAAASGRHVDLVRP